jgi:putative ATPase
MDNSSVPLADRIRPKSLKDFVGQEHLVGKKGIIRKLIETDQLPSMIFWGPPGSGKTTLAHIIAQATQSHFIHQSAVTTSLKDVRQAVKEARERLEKGEQLSLDARQHKVKKEERQRTIFFLDEIHRFNKAQQDAFLPHVEKGTIILIGATTENPSFEVIGPLLSRSRVFVLNQLTPNELKIIVKRGLKEVKAKIEPKALDFLINASNGDARIGLNAIEIANSLITSHRSPITLKVLKDVFQKQSLLYDRAGDEHYNTISAFIKSMRASDADAALYYLARMVEAGEDPLFIARRMVVFASEDIGMAQPTALVVANEIFGACDTIGYPECAINLAHGVVYLCKAPKDRSAYNGLRAAQEDVKKHGNLPIPLEILNAPTKLMKKLGYGKGYEPYPKNKSLLPQKLKGKKYYSEKK